MPSITQTEPANVRGERSVLLDCLKGFGILLVILGHSVQYDIGHGFEANPIVRFIHSFDMPMFMFISGYVSVHNKDRSIEKLSEKFRSLVIPFLAWFVIYYAISRLITFGSDTDASSFAASLLTLLRMPDAGLWFLWILFLNHLVLFVSRWINPRREELYVLLILLLVNICWRLFKMDYLGIGLLRWHLAFYLFGYAVKKHFVKIESLFNAAGIASCFMFPLLACFWMSTGVPTFYHLLEVDPRLRDVICLVYNYLVAFTGILAMYTYFKYLLGLAPAIEKPLVYFGRLTIEIYCCHAIFFSFMSGMPALPFWARVLFKCLVCLAGSLLLQYLIKQSGLLSALLFGRKKNKAHS